MEAGGGAGWSAPQSALGQDLDRRCCQQCGASTETLSTYYVRHRICRDCNSNKTVMREGIASRWCAQCGHFQPLTDFEGDRRSCRAQLHKHNLRRQRNRAVTKAGPYEEHGAVPASAAAATAYDHAAAAYVHSGVPALAQAPGQYAAAVGPLPLPLGYVPPAGSAGLGLLPLAAAPSAGSGLLPLAAPLLRGSASSLPPSPESPPQLPAESNRALQPWDGAGVAGLAAPSNPDILLLQSLLAQAQQPWAAAQAQQAQEVQRHAPQHQQSPAPPQQQPAPLLPPPQAAVHARPQPVLTSVPSALAQPPPQLHHHQQQPQSPPQHSSPPFQQQQQQQQQAPLPLQQKTQQMKRERELDRPALSDNAVSSSTLSAPAPAESEAGMRWGAKRRRSGPLPEDAAAVPAAAVQLARDQQMQQLLSALLHPAQHQQQPRPQLPYQQQPLSPPWLPQPLSPPQAVLQHQQQQPLRLPPQQQEAQPAGLAAMLRHLQSAAGRAPPPRAAPAPSPPPNPPDPPPAAPPTQADVRALADAAAALVPWLAQGGASMGGTPPPLAPQPPPPPQQQQQVMQLARALAQSLVDVATSAPAPPPAAPAPVPPPAAPTASGASSLAEHEFLDHLASLLGLGPRLQGPY